MLKKLKCRGVRDFIFFGTVGLCMAFISSAFANNLTASGYWQTIDPDTNKVSSVIQIQENPKNGLYFGKIYKIFPEGNHHTTDICVNCRDERRNQPILGLVIIRDMRFDGEKYVGGWILDPRDGKEYHGRLKVIDGGKALKLRGYIGLPLFGQTRVWQRVAKPTV